MVIKVIDSAHAEQWKPLNIDRIAFFLWDVPRENNFIGSFYVFLYSLELFGENYAVVYHRYAVSIERLHTGN